MNNSSTAEFRTARDLLLMHRDDYATAYDTFRWPELKEFNWALDHFDSLAQDNTQRALWIVEESGSVVTRSFDELRRASNRAANYLQDMGIRRGDRLLVMLPNRVELWEISNSPTSTHLADLSGRRKDGVHHETSGRQI